MALPSEEAVDVRAIKNVDVDGPDKSGDTYDSDDDILNSFNVVVESTNANCSAASSVSVYDICSSNFRLSDVFEFSQATLTSVNVTKTSCALPCVNRT